MRIQGAHHFDGRHKCEDWRCMRFYPNDDDLDENLPLPEDYIPDNDNIPVRTSSDQNVISGHGKHLLKFCKSTQFRVMNGRWEKMRR